MLALFKFIWSHPLNKGRRVAAIIRFLKWQTLDRLKKGTMVHQFTSRSMLFMDHGMSGATQNLYCGLHDYWEMLFLLHFLRPEDQFIDVGANVGTYTVLAGSHCRAHVVAIEPSPTTYSKLLNNVVLNEIEKVELHNTAVGSEKGSINFTTNLDTTNHVVLDQAISSIKVEMTTMDTLLPPNDNYKLLKIDVEGFEAEVLKGATVLLDDPRLTGVLIETNGSGVRFGYSDEYLHQAFLDKGFTPYTYDPRDRKLERQQSYGSNNTLYLRNLKVVEERISNAEEIQIFNQYY